jgi:hypothetical protein
MLIIFPFASPFSCFFPAFLEFSLLLSNSFLLNGVTVVLLTLSLELGSLGSYIPPTPPVTFELTWVWVIMLKVVMSMPQPMGLSLASLVNLNGRHCPKIFLYRQSIPVPNLRLT